MTTRDITSYFKPTKLSALPSGMLQSTIDCVNRELKAISSAAHSRDGVGKKTRGEYIKLDEERATVGEYAAKHGIAAVIRHFKVNKHFPTLKEASVRGWKNAYMQVVPNQSTDRKRGGDPLAITELPQKRCGRPFLLGEELEEEVKLFIKFSCADGTVVNTETVMGTATTMPTC